MPIDLASITAALEAMGPGGVFLAGLIDASCVPLLNFVSVLVVTQAALAPKAWLAGASLAAAGSTLGSWGLYWAARSGGKLAGLRRIGSLDQVKVKLEQSGVWALLAPAASPIPLPMKPTIVAAGVTRMGQVRFLSSLAIGYSVRYFGLALLAAWFGPGAIAVAMFLVPPTLISAAIIGVCYGLVQLRNSRRTPLTIGAQAG